MPIIIGDGKNTVEVMALSYGDTFRYSGNLYMRVDSHNIKSYLERNMGAKFSGKFHYSSLNTEAEVLVIRLSSGRISYFQRTTCVEPIDLHCTIKEKDCE